MADVEAAIQEMFQAPHIQVRWNFLSTDLFLNSWSFITFDGQFRISKNVWAIIN